MARTCAVTNVVRRKEDFLLLTNFLVLSPMSMRYNRYIGKNPQRGELHNMCLREDADEMSEVPG
jgi:hypothetical protein